MFSFIHFHFEVTTNFKKNSEKKNMTRRMYQGGSSTKRGPRHAMREQGDEPPREAEVRACEWPSEEFMVNAGIKDEFDA